MKNKPCGCKHEAARLKATKAAANRTAKRKVTLPLHERLGLTLVRKWKPYGNRGDGFLVGKDKNGHVVVFTHRAKSKPYPSFEAIPEKTKLFIASTA